MTEPIDPTSGGTPDVAPRQAIDPALLAYIRANRATITEGALRQAAIEAGHAPGAVEAALQATREIAPPVDRGRAVRNLFLAYLAVYLILSALMLVNPANNTSGFLGNMSGIGIIILSMALGAAFVGSLIWVASRRLFVGLLGVIVVLYAVSAMLTSYQGGAVVLGLVVGAIGVGLILAAAGVGRRPGVAAAPSMALLMTLPLLALVVIGGICVASGLPIPRPA